MFNQYNGSTVANAIIDYQKALGVIQWLLDNNLIQLEGENTVESLAKHYAGKVIIDGLSDRIDFSK